ncbi:unnamed protein product [Sphagnum jensenii]|jgi:hypothetical protein
MLHACYQQLEAAMKKKNSYYLFPFLSKTEAYNMYSSMASCTAGGVLHSCDEDQDGQLAGAAQLQQV